MTRQRDVAWSSGVPAGSRALQGGCRSGWLWDQDSFFSVGVDEHDGAALFGVLGENGAEVRQVGGKESRLVGIGAFALYRQVEREPKALGGELSES